MSEKRKMDKDKQKQELSKNEGLDGIRTKRGGTIVIDGVRVWSELAVTLPLGDTTAHLRFAFGHERLAKSSAEVDVKKAAAMTDSFNEEELERRIRKYRRVIERALSDEDDDEDASDKQKASSARARAAMRRSQR